MKLLCLRGQPGCLAPSEEEDGARICARGGPAESQYLKKLKVLGEDIMAGKVTMPVAKAMSRMNKADRQKLWDTVSSNLFL